MLSSGPRRGLSVPAIVTAYTTVVRGLTDPTSSPYLLQMTSTPRKLVYALTMLVAALGATEGALRVASVVVHRWIVREDAAASVALPGATRLLLCVGDSVTFGMPDGPAKAYPQALQSRGAPLLSFLGMSSPEPP